MDKKTSHISFDQASDIFLNLLNGIEVAPTTVDNDPQTPGKFPVEYNDLPILELMDELVNKYKIDFNMISDKYLILPENRIELLNKNKKIIKKIVNLEKINKNIIEKDFKRKQFINKKFIKKGKFKKKYFYQSKIRKNNFDNKKSAKF